LPHSLHGNGKYCNSSIEQEVNRGNYGKFTVEQIEERYELHARRWNNGVPTLQQIVDHWKNKYDIEITKQSEKEWALRDKNKIAIEAVQEKMLEDGKLEVTTISGQTLVNSVSEGARSLASFMKSVKTKGADALRNFDADMTPWGVVGVSKAAYLNASKEQMKEWKPRVDNELAIKKATVSMVKDLSKVMTTNSEELRKTIELADQMRKDNSAKNASNSREFEKNSKKQAIQDSVGENLLKGIKDIPYVEVDMEAIREKFDGKDN